MTAGKPAGRLAVVVLAAGSGTRMRSSLPKVLHPAAGRPMLGHVLRASRALGPERVVVVTGHGADRVEAAFADAGVAFARQTEQLGTAHAFLMARPALEGHAGEVLVLYGDTPLLRAETLSSVVAEHRAGGAGLSVITAELEDPTGYGRIIRAPSGEVLRIVEEKAATLAEKAVRETNSGVYVLSARAFEMAEGIGSENPAGEYYLTDILERYRTAGERALAHKVADATELMGVNDRAQLAFAERVLRDRARQRLMAGGATLQDPATVYADDGVEVGQDAVIAPGVFLEGSTRVGAGSYVGPYSRLVDAVLEPGSRVVGWTVVEGARLEAGAQAGPFARLRPGTVLAADAHAGNFVELKNVRLGEGAKAGHLTYLGDAEVGAGANIGAGTITANYDGVDKHRTRVGAGAFIGSNSVLIAPVTVGDGAFVAAGSAVSEDVPEGALALARGEQRNVPGWSERWWSRALPRARAGDHPVLRRWLETKGSAVAGSEPAAAVGAPEV